MLLDVDTKMISNTLGLYYKAGFIYLGNIRFSLGFSVLRSLLTSYRGKSPW